MTDITLIPQEHQINTCTHKVTSVSGIILRQLRPQRPWLPSCRGPNSYPQVCLQTQAWRTSQQKLHLVSDLDQLRCSEVSGIHPVRCSGVSALHGHPVRCSEVSSLHLVRCSEVSGVRQTDEHSSNGVTTQGSSHWTIHTHGYVLLWYWPPH